MLHAVLHGKAGRVSTEDGEAQSWRELFRKREDLLTATFFGRLRYLSEEGERKILGLLVGEELAGTFGPIREIFFWPRLEGLEDRSYVEPDVVLIFEETLLLIEVKPPFGSGQSEGQWQAQIKSLILQRGVESAPFEVPESFHFLALGRNIPGYRLAADRLLDEHREEGLVSVHTHQWAEVCDGIHELGDSEDGRDGIVYADWIKAFDLFGMVEKPLSFSDLVKFSVSIKPGWRGQLDLVPVPKVQQVEPEIDWQPLAEMIRRMNLDAGIWT